MSVTDEYLKNNEAYASTFTGPLPLPPSKHVAVVACMDARLDVYRILGLGDGEAHVIRNAGGVVTDDEIRSLAISQRLLGTKEIILIHHTDCGMLTFTDDEFKRAIQDETGIKPEWAAEAFPIWKKTCVSHCAASRRARSSPNTNPCADSSSTSPPGGSTKSSSRRLLGIGGQLAGTAQTRTPDGSAVNDVRMVLQHATPADENGAAVQLNATAPVPYVSSGLRSPFPPIADYAFLSDC